MEGLNTMEWEAPQLTLITINETENVIDFIFGLSV